MRKLLIFFAVLFTTAFSLLPAGAQTRFAIPPGYHIAAWERMGSGLDHISVRFDGGSNAQAVQVARLEPSSGYQLRAVVGDQSLTGRLEKTSSMCARVNCMVAVNGDFFTPASGEPTGGLSILGQAIRSPLASRPQLHLDKGHLSIANESWWGQMSFDQGRVVTLDGINVPLQGGKISLYTDAWGQSTRNQPGVTELGVQIVSPSGPFLIGRDTRVRLITTQHTGDAPIPEGGAVLAGEGTGAHALDMLWGEITHHRLAPDALVQIRSSNPAADSIGGNPVLLHNGHFAFAPSSTSLYAQRHPRTVVGWNPQGETFLVAIDGRQPGYAAGMTLVEAASMLQRMGATDAINLDGGGSTTFVTHGGHLVNQPSTSIVDHGGYRSVIEESSPGDRVIGHVERAVATALVIVPVSIPHHATHSGAATVPLALDRRFMPLSDLPALRWGEFSSANDNPTRGQPIVIALTLQFLIFGEIWLRRKSLRQKRSTGRP